MILPFDLGTIKCIIITCVSETFNALVPNISYNRHTM